jgi:hypothetical protein
LAAGLLADRVSYGAAFGVGAGLLVAAAVSAVRMPGGRPVAPAAPEGLEAAPGGIDPEAVAPHSVERAGDREPPAAGAVG